METSNLLENVLSEKKATSEKYAHDACGLVILERSKSESDAKTVESKNGNNEKNLKSSQRSMRRGSGAGSPNSQLSIPRYPAFDFGEQEDLQALFPYLSEPEANRSIKPEILQGTRSAEAVTDTESSQNTSHMKDTSQKKRDTTKSKSLMPELVENSETESAKGSFECEALDLPPSVEIPPIPVPDITFPSLPNTFLAKLGVHKDSPLPVEAFDEQELESKFIALSLAFKTDRTTLRKRLELQKRQRDMTEKNVESEFQLMRDNLNALNLKATTSDVRDLISKIQNHLDIAQQAATRVSGRSETYGAVQQEERISRAFEVLVLYVDHLKRLFDKEHKELEETKRMLIDTRVVRKDFGVDGVSEDQKKYSKSFGLPVTSIKSVGRRRASVADFHQHYVLDSSKAPGFSQSWTSGFGMSKVEPKQSTFCPTASSVALSSSSLPTSPVTSVSSNRLLTPGIGARRRSLPAASPMAPNMLRSLEAESDESKTNKKLSSEKERTVWRRKLSSVTDEKEQSEDEVDAARTGQESESEGIAETTQRTARLLSFMNQVEDKIYNPSSDFNTCLHPETESRESDSAEEECDNTDSSILQTIRNSVTRWIPIQAVPSYNVCTRYFHGEFIFVALKWLRKLFTRFLSRVIRKSH